jgi:hypothetical protein
MFPLLSQLTTLLAQSDEYGWTTHPQVATWLLVAGAVLAGVAVFYLSSARSWSCSCSSCCSA